MLTTSAQLSISLEESQAAASNKIMMAVKARQPLGILGRAMRVRTSRLMRSQTNLEMMSTRRDFEMELEVVKALEVMEALWRQTRLSVNHHP